MSFGIKRFLIFLLLLLSFFFEKNENLYAQVPPISLNPKTLDFGSVNVGKNLIDTIHIQNNTSGQVLVYFDISDVDSGYFHLISRPSYVTDSIAAFSELSVTIRSLQIKPGNIHLIFILMYRSMIIHHQHNYWVLE